MKTLMHIFYAVFYLIIISCSVQDEKLEEALRFSESNSGELEKVLQDYSLSPEDSLKYKAVVFLIKNMPYHYYQSG